VDTDPALLVNACYNYQVRAVTANIDVSTWAVAASAGCTPAAVLQQINLTATATSGTRVDLTWTSNATSASFTVKRNGATLGTVGKTAATSYNYADTTAQPGTTYIYTVEATASSPLVVGTSTVTTPAVPVAPSAAAATANGLQVTVTWKDNSNNEDGFVVERAPVVNGIVGGYQQVPGVGAFLAPNTVSFLDTAPLEAATSVYRVKAINLVAGDSGYALTNNVTVGLFAPANLVAAINPGLPAATNVNVTVSWLDVSQKETSYKVERMIGAAAWTTIQAALPANTVQLADTFPAVTTATTVQYRVTAVAGTLTSQAVTTSVTIPARPNTGTITTVNGATSTSLNVNFTLPAGSVGYQLQRRIGTNGAWTLLTPTLGTGTISVTDTGLTSNTIYQYQIKFANPGGWSANWSTATKQGTTLYPVPVAVNDLVTLTADVKATQAFAGINVLANDSLAGNNTRTVTNKSAVTRVSGGGANPATVTSLTWTTAGVFTLNLSSPAANNTDALRQASKRGVYTFTYTETYQGMTSAPATVTVTVN
jgi:hypothetical protein